jgi:hypothetical protein
MIQSDWDDSLQKPLRVSLPNRFMRLEQCAGCVKKMALICAILVPPVRPVQQCLLPLIAHRGRFFIPRRLLGVAAIVMAFDKERKGFDLHAAWGPASGG